MILRSLSAVVALSAILLASGCCCCHPCLRPCCWRARCCNTCCYPVAPGGCESCCTPSFAPDPLRR